jgi:pilus assembly protein CpaC
MNEDMVLKINGEFCPVSKQAFKKLFILFLFVLIFAGLGASHSCAQTASGELDPIVLSVDRSENITLSEPADSVFIASPDIADVQVISPTVITVYGRKPGETSLVASKKDGTILLKRKIVVDTDLGKLQNVLGTMMPKIKALPVPGGIVLDGTTASSVEAANAQKIAKKFLGNDKGEVINQLKISGDEQIQLRVRVAEVSKTVNKVFGINWDTVALLGGMTLGIKSGTSFLADTVLRDSGAGGVADRYGRSNTNNGVYGGYNGGGLAINGLVDALAEDGLLTLLAEPNLVAKSGETATFLAGGEFPVPVPQQNGAVTVVFKPYGVSLAFTPTVVGKNRISIQVRPEVSELTTTGSITLNNITIPALLTRRAETTVELGSGQTFAICGLIRSYQNNDIRKFPFLGDVPIIGALFRSTQFRNNQSELVILVTPYLVKPSSEPLAIPNDGYAPATDIDRMLLGKTSADGIPNVPLRQGETLQGPVGFSAE